MKKILLIRPKSPETFWQLTGLLEIIKRKAVIPPLSLATVAALTPSHYEVKILDEEIDKIDFDTECDIVGITGYTLHSKRMFEISKEFKKRGVLTVGGGPYCSAHPDEAKLYFDVVIAGEAEFIWSKFLMDYEKGDFLDCYIEKDRVDLSFSPIPRWDLVPLEKYSGNMVQTSRGCPYDCEFCDVVALFGRKMRHKSLEQILKEIKFLVSINRFEIFLADDNFIGNKKFVKELLKELIALNNSLKKPIRYITQVTLNVAEDEELLDLFKEANFYCLFIGIETPKKDSLIATNKGHNAKLDMKESIRRIQSRGIFIISGMIVGFDNDDEDIFALQRDFLIDSGLTIPMLGMLIAPRGTKLWDRLSKEGRLYPEFEAGDMFAVTNFEPSFMSKGDLEKNYVKLLKEIFSPQHFAKSFKSLIDQVNLNEVKKNSPLSRQLDIRYFRFYYLGVSFRIFKHYLFSSNKEKRKLLFSLLKIAFKKGIICIPWAIELLLYFKAENDFVTQHNIDTPYSNDKSPKKELVVNSLNIK
ncbi:MAG: B12-binding domain-containing radical SAM protein [Spirochaetota bacterium]|nr:B12-binding domain-containing radical SAM protein [Spirochaetota bacterium]